MCDSMAFHQEAILTSAVFKYIGNMSSIPVPRSFRREQIFSVSTSKLCITSSHFDTSNNSAASGSCNVTTSFLCKKQLNNCVTTGVTTLLLTSQGVISVYNKVQPHGLTTVCNQCKLLTREHHSVCVQIIFFELTVN